MANTRTITLLPIFNNSRALWEFQNSRCRDLPNRALGQKPGGERKTALLDSRRKPERA